MEDLRRDVRLRRRSEVDKFTDRCQGVGFSCIFRHLVEAFGYGADDLVASDAIDPLEDATALAVDSARAMTFW